MQHGTSREEFLVINVDLLPLSKREIFIERERERYKCVKCMYKLT